MDERLTYELSTLDVEGIIKRDLWEQCRARLKADVPDAPDGLLDMFADILLGSLGIKAPHRPADSATGSGESFSSTPPATGR